MSSRSTNSSRRSNANSAATVPTGRAAGERLIVQSWRVGALPILNHFLARLNLRDLLHGRLRRQDRRAGVPAPEALLVLLRNLLLCREPVYGVGEWAARHAPDLLGLPAARRNAAHAAALLSDDCVGRALDRLFDTHGPTFLLAVVRQAVQEFQLKLDELHNDSTTVTFCGAYPQAEQEGRRRGRITPAITYGHNKDHRPDLKQLLYILTVTEDGGVPVHVQVASGNTADDVTHPDTWELLRQLVGRPDFVYVADCKLASAENLRRIAGQGGRFVSVLPATRREDGEFREQLRQNPQTITWRWLYDVRDAKGKLLDQFRVCEQEHLTSDGWRLYWYRSLRKQQLDAQGRAGRTQRAAAALLELQRRLTGPRTRMRERAPVQAAVDEILKQFQASAGLQVTIHECEEEEFRQVSPGRPGPNTQYVREVKRSFELSWRIDPEALAREERDDGVFPLVSNVPEWDAEAVLRAYKRQPRIEKRFSQFKTDYEVAPVWLKSVSRIEALLIVYFLALLVQTLIERELRQAMEREGLKSLPLYPEGRACRRPTTRRLLDLFEDVQRHRVRLADGSEEEVVTELTPLQRRLLRLLGMSPREYGR